ncbi:extracellular solute-binding protein [Paenibacillus hexagrammi]|uniref:Extracellular solute-binding protein n=1 Tax=Paenibacillus hexagrammi TaxID=2908839 RepID=A0ABY3SHY2_9BACL|nr:extracellular solute-binding protein [Paenibacillus sp. YPD9-1]UJF32844.1 extracellular solute-binding protein [Paenibacillus sp. YPD9-1]
MSMRSAVMIILTVILTSACSWQHKPSAETVKYDEVASESHPITEPQGELTIWAPDRMFDYEIEQFQRRFPKVHITLTVLDNVPRLADYYLNALAEDKAPDLMVLRDRMLGDFNTTDKLENLLAAPYRAGKYQSSLGEGIWRQHSSMDGKRLVAMPYQSQPMVTFYRADVLKEAGLPDDPEALADYMEEPDRWLAMAKLLQEQDKWIVQWRRDTVDILNNGDYFFDNRLDYERGKESYLKSMKAAKQVRSLTLNMSMWIPPGRML